MAEKLDKREDTEIMGIVIDDGSRRVPIKNIYGDEIGVFYFHPADVGIVERYNELADSFDLITKPLEEVSVGPDGQADTEAGEAALKEAERRLYEAVDKLFAGNMSEAFFGKMHPFSPVNGAFYCELAIEKVGEYINAQFDTETDKITKRVEKYTNGRQKR